MTQSAESIRIFRTVEKEAQLARPLSRTEFSALCLLSFASTFLAAMTVIPVFGLVQHFCGPGVGWRAACLMITIPSIAVFAPRSDIVYAFTGMWVLWLIVSAMLSTSRWLASVLSVLAGIVTFVSLTISLAHLPVVIAAILFTAMMLLGQHRLSWSHVLFRGGVMTGAFLLAVVGWTAVTDCNLFQVWRLNLSNHAGFYDQSTRTWWKWLLVNPIELGFSVGLPLSFTCLMAVVSERRSQHSESQVISPTRWTFRRLCTALLLTWTALWLSGKNMGEAARLWCFLTPWFVIVASLSLQAARSRADESSQLLQGKTAGAYYSSRLDFWVTLLIAQLVVSTLTTGRVSGYLEL
jgi:hypothetical protein